MAGQQLCGVGVHLCESTEARLCGLSPIAQHRWIMCSNRLALTVVAAFALAGLDNAGADEVRCLLALRQAVRDDLGVLVDPGSLRSATQSGCLHEGLGPPREQGGHRTSNLDLISLLAAFSMRSSLRKAAQRRSLSTALLGGPREGQWGRCMGLTRGDGPQQFAVQPQLG